MTNENFWQRPTNGASDYVRPADLRPSSSMFSSSTRNAEKRLRALEAAVFGQGNDSALEGIAEHHCSPVNCTEVSE